MKPFTYLEPDTLAGVLDALAQRGPTAAIIAGGQSLLLGLKSRAVTPAYLISIGAVPELRGWRSTPDGGLEIGAATTYTALARAHLQGWHAELARVASNLADEAVRNLGTLGGAVCQAEVRFDVPPFLVAVEATMTLASRGGKRVVPADRFFAAGGGTCRAPDEVLTHVTLPAPHDDARVCFEKFQLRAFEAALVSVACAVRTDARGRIGAARIVVGGIARAPVRVAGCGDALIGEQLTQLDRMMIGARVADEAMPRATRDAPARAYQAEIIAVLMEAALARAAGHAGHHAP